MFVCMQKINFIFPLFLEVLQRICNIVILGTLDMPGYSQQKWCYQLVENLDIYIHAKNQAYSSPVSSDIAKILQTWYFR